MKKNYITPKIKLSKTSIGSFLVNASIQTGTAGKDGSDYVNGYGVPDNNDNDNFEVGAKNRFYGGSNDSWE